jgi:hypothetical protein
MLFFKEVPSLIENLNFYIPGSILKGILRQALMPLTDNLKPLDFRNKTEFVVSIPTGSGKSNLLGIISQWLLVRCIGQKWKQDFPKNWTVFSNQSSKNRPVFEVLRKELMSYTSTGIVESGLTLKLSSINFECEPNRQTFIQHYGRCGRTYSLRSSSDIDNILFSDSPVQCLLSTLEQTSKEIGFLSIQEKEKRKCSKGVGFQNCDSSSSKILNPRLGIETSPVLYRRLLSLFFFTDLIPTRGLKQLFVSNNHKFRFWEGIFRFFANWGLRLNKFLTMDYLKSIKLYRFRWQFEKINLKRDVINYLILLKEEGYQLLNNQINLFGLAKINIRSFVDKFLLISKLLFRRFLIDKRCDFIFLVEMPP